MVAMNAANAINASSAPMIEHRVIDLMTFDPITVSVDATLAEAEQLMRHNDVSGLPVVDRGNRLVGVISQTDLVDLAAPAIEGVIDHPDTELRVGDVMSTPAVTVDAYATLLYAAQRMQEKQVHRLVVVDEDGAPIGVLSTTDFVRLAAGC